MKAEWRLLGLIAVAVAALVWAVPFLWMAVASLRPGVPPDIASLTPAGPFGFDNFVEAWNSGSFPLWYLNTVLMCGGILLVQLVTISMAGYTFARLRFTGRDLLFSAFLLQLLLIPPLLIVPNLATLVSLHLYDRLPGIMLPYFASAFGVFLMRQTFRAMSDRSRPAPACRWGSASSGRGPAASRCPRRVSAEPRQLSFCRSMWSVLTRSRMPS
jgi:sn-glycerol 3-phosphate transport system permease protein